MIFDPMPIVHVFPYDMFGHTEHQTDNEHECWCEPRTAIVPAGHQFAKEDHATRVFYHSNVARKSDMEDNMLAKERRYLVAIRKLLRSIPEPPAGGWDPVELTEGIDRLVQDVLTNGWRDKTVTTALVAPPMEGQPTLGLLFPHTYDSIHLQGLRGLHQQLMRQFGLEPPTPPTDDAVLKHFGLMGKPGEFRCTDCHKLVQDCTCDDDDDGNDDDGGSPVWTSH